MQLIRRSLSLVLACLVLLWAGASFADDTELFVSELAEHVQGSAQASQDGADLDSPESPESPGLTTAFVVLPPLLPRLGPTGLPPALQSVCHPPTLPPPRRA